MSMFKPICMEVSNLKSECGSNVPKEFNVCFDGKNMSEIDYLVIGLGTTSCPLVKKLTDDKCISVVVLEAGSNFSKDPVIQDANVINYFVNAQTAKYTTGIPSETEANIGGVKYVTSQGIMWGGTGNHNYSVAVRQSPFGWAKWAQAGGKEWSYQRVLPLMKELETYVPNGVTDTSPSPLRGRHGPITISQSTPSPPGAESLNRIVAQGISEATGIPIVSDYNAGTESAVDIDSQLLVRLQGTPEAGQFPVTRSGPTDWLIYPKRIISQEGEGLHGRKLKIISRAVVYRILFKGKRAIGVEFLLKNKHTYVIYAKNVIVSAGLQSSCILQRSGIGPASLLKSLHIPVVIDNPLVGQNFRTQTGPEMVIGTSNASLVVPFATTTSIVADTGAIAFLPYQNDPRRWQVIALKGLAGGTALGIGQFITFFASNINPGSPNLFSNFILDLEPSSKGSINIVDKSPFKNPDIIFNFYTTQDDIQSGIASYYVLYNTFLRMQIDHPADNFTLVYPPVSAFNTGNDVKNLLPFIEFNSVVNDHYSGANIMNSDPDLGVVDGHLKVHKAENLYVADASIFPRQVNGNPTDTCYVVGLQLAKFLKSHHKHNKH